MLETLKTIADICGWVLSISALLSLLLKPVRSKLAAWIKNASGTQILTGRLDRMEEEDRELKEKVCAKNKAMNDTLIEMRDTLKALNTDLTEHIRKDDIRFEAQMNSLKNNLMRDFYFYIDRGYISFEELSLLEDVYHSYTCLNGNGCVKATWDNFITKLPPRCPYPNDRRKKKSLGEIHSVETDQRIELQN